MSTGRRLKWEPQLSPYTKTNSKGIKDLNANPETLKLLEENIGSTLHDISAGKHFMNKTPFAQELRPKISFIKQKSCRTARVKFKL